MCWFADVSVLRFVELTSFVGSPGGSQLSPRRGHSLDSVEGYPIGILYRRVHPIGACPAYVKKVSSGSFSAFSGGEIDIESWAVLVKRTFKIVWRS